jgi:hypothetical protein
VGNATVVCGAAVYSANKVLLPARVAGLPSIRLAGAVAALA